VGKRREAIGALMLALDTPRLEGTATGRAMAAGIMGELGDALFQDGQPQMALAFCQEAFRRQRSAAHAATLSCVMLDLGRDADALRVTEQVQPVSPAVLINRSIALEGLGRLEQSIRTARQVLAATPGNAFAQLHLATTLLVQGHLTAEAWRLYEGRLELAGISKLPEAPRWTGNRLPGGTILLHAEQGMGDTLQFVRYAPLLAERSGARVVLAVQPALARLLKGAPGTDAIVSVGGALPKFDAFLPLMSLPLIFATTLASIPPAIPYATVQAATSTENTRLQAGLVWAGSGGFVADRQRSLPETFVLALAGVAGVDLHSLQFDATPECVRRLGLIDRMGGVTDFCDTAARIAGLDLVIAVDTSVAHLAATMGKPVWLLSRFRGCWRWLQGREDSPWYPTLRIFRQDRAGDWATVVTRVRAELAALAGPRNYPATHA
jgi:hypothetical protein